MLQIMRSNNQPNSISACLLNPGHPHTLSSKSYLFVSKHQILSTLRLLQIKLDLHQLHQIQTAQLFDRKLPFAKKDGLPNRVQMMRSNNG